jgi:hypothetical protein
MANQFLPLRLVELSAYQVLVFRANGIWEQSGWTYFSSIVCHLPIAIWLLSGFWRLLNCAGCTPAKDSYLADHDQSNRSSPRLC